MTLPAGWTALPLDAARGVPQSAALPAPAGLRVTVVAAAADLARLLSAPTDQVVHDAGQRLVRVPAAATDDPAVPAHVRARSTAQAALSSPPPDSLSTAAVPVTLLVTEPTGLCAAWPALPGRALPVRSRAGALLGHLWVEALTLAAGTLVAAGPCGAELTVGWRAADAAPPATPPEQEDPYDGLV